MKYVGLDVGSVSAKLVVMDRDGRILHSSHRRHKGQSLAVASDLLKAACLQDQSGKGAVGNEGLSLSLTGSAGRLIGRVLGIPPVNEVVAFAYATRRLYPSVRTVIELGGEDSKLIFIGEDAASVRDFSMNSVCAAGTGSFIDQQAERLRISIEEFGSLALKSQNPPRIAGRCSVFAKSDMIHLQQIATPVEDIVAGLCFAVARNFKGAISRGRELVPPVSFQGGVAANQGMIRAFKEVLGIEELLVPEKHVLMGAIGAALKDMDSGAINRFDLSRLEAFIHSVKPSEKGWSRLDVKGGHFLKEDPVTGATPGAGSGEKQGGGIVPKRAYLGIDIGSISTNLAVIDEESRLLAKRYLMTAGRPIEAVKQGLAEIGAEIGDAVDIAGVGTTGSGRYMIADFVGADIVKNEITAQATAAAFIDRDVDTIFEIGGQDSKYISLRDGVIADFEMNKACAAGTGSFLEEQAEKLDISVKTEFQECAFSAQNPCRLGERCTVFMENSLMANLQQGSSKEDLLAGLSYSIVQNYINRVVGKRRIGDKIFFQGGVAFNKSVVAAFEGYLGKEIIVPPHHDVTGAIGMALIAMDHMAGRGPGQRDSSAGQSTSFKGFSLSQRPYEISSFECKGCPNVCEINRVKVAGEEGSLFYGGRCEKYDVRKKKKESAIPDLFALREEMLWKSHLKYSEESHVKSEGTGLSRATIGIPYVFYFQDFLPYWTTLLWELGFTVAVSPKTDRRIIDLGLERMLAETCFPVKTAHGHIRHLIEAKADYILLPSFVNVNPPEAESGRGLACPYTQTVPYAARVAFPEVAFLNPVVDLHRGDAFLKKELWRIFQPLGIKRSQLEPAMKKAAARQEDFSRALRLKGKEVLAGLTEKTLVLVGRTYNASDRGMNLNVPKKLADLGVQSIPMDLLPLDDSGISRSWPNMYWRSGQRILSAARLIRSHPLLYAVYIGNFSCGPDSFITKFFDDEMSGKPYLHLELDAHSADAGAVTRCEAFLDSIGNGRTCRERSAVFAAADTPDHGLRTTVRGSRTVFLPRMSDHALALAAAFRRCGIDAEVLPESSRESVELGRKYVSGKECYPCAVTTGDMVRKVVEPGFDPGRAAFFMPSGTGPCRFGQYNIFHRLVLRDLGLSDLPVFSPNQDENFYEHLGIAGREFATQSWRGVIAIELLSKCLREIRPYERKRGTADGLYRDYLARVCASIDGTNGDLGSVLGRARTDFEQIAVQQQDRPLIGIVGEIFVRSNSFSNEDLVRRIEALGGEAYLAPVEEWISYVNHMAIRRVLIKREWSAMINLLLKRFFQRKIEHGFARRFAGLLKNLHEPDTGKLLRLAAPYIHDSFEGEAILSIGKSISLLEHGAAGLVNAMPFGCMPGTIVSGLMRGLNADFGVPCLSIPFDGTESLTMTIQLEAFMDQAREFKKRKRR